VWSENVRVVLFRVQVTVRVKMDSSSVIIAIPLGLGGGTRYFDLTCAGPGLRDIGAIGGADIDVGVGVGAGPVLSAFSSA
jgi:hypothetical protein